MRKKALIILAALVLGAVLALFGGAWYFSGQVIDPSASREVDYSLTIKDVASGKTGKTVTFTRAEGVAFPGQYGLRWPDGYARVGKVVSSDDTTVTRTLEGIDHGSLEPGLKVSFDSRVYQGDPRSALGLDFSDIRYRGELGQMPAWHVPAKTPKNADPKNAAEKGTWVVAVHGWGADRQEALRMLPALHRAGYPVLVPTYRNDVGAPEGPGGVYHLGDSEWRDVQDAMRWGLEHGAQRFVLFGMSMGGAISLQTADRSELTDKVSALVLDDPAVDWRDILDHQAAQRHVPSLLASLAGWTVERRTGLSLDRLDWSARAKDLRKPTLIFSGPDDDFIPWQPARELAAARPDLVRLEEFQQAGHVRNWNVDPERYERELTAFLDRQR